MKALKCDICGGYFDGTETINGMPENKTPNRLQIYHKAYSGHIKDYIDVDICPECYLAIKKTMDDRIKGGSKNARTENG